ncbi:MAG: thioesterase family protein [Chloroflexota bacterium]
MSETAATSAGPKRAESGVSGFTHCHKLRVRYAETDAMGVVYYANYLTYFEVARVEYLRSAGIDYRSLEDAKMTGAVTTAHVSYHLPAKFDDELSLWTRCVSMGKVRFRIEYEVRRDDDRVLVASGYTEHALLAHETLRPVRIPDWVKAGIERFEAKRHGAPGSAAPPLTGGNDLEPPTFSPAAGSHSPASSPADGPHPPATSPAPVSGRADS